jgi:Acyl-CoA dehydrogenases
MIWNLSLNEEVDLLRETVRTFAERELAPIADQIDRDNEFPNELWKKLGDLGLLGITVPEVYGGSEMSYLCSSCINGRNLEMLRISRTFLWRPFQFVCQSNSTLRK